MERRKIGIGLAGLGNVGLGVFLNLEKNREVLTQRCHADLALRKIAVRDIGKSRGAEIPADLLTSRWQDLLEDEGVDVIVELMGGVGEAKQLVEAALRKRKVVVTGNKALLAEHGREIFGLAKEMATPIHFEAAVAGGIPIIKTVKESLVGNRIHAIYGIINGTSNFILTRMREAGISYEEALAEAQSLGYAEADPTLDVSGWDAGHKAVLLASLACGRWVPYDKISVSGVANIQSRDMRFAEKLGYRIKLLAVIRQEGADQMEVRVQPSLVPERHLLAAVNGVFNAVMVQGDLVGETLFYGSGAGQDPTSSSVISDLVDAAVGLQHAEKRGQIPSLDLAEVVPLEETISQYYLRLTVDNRPGVLAQVAAITGKHNVGITSVIQPEASGDLAELVLMLDAARHGAIQAALAEIQALPSNREPATLLRMELLS